MPVRLLRYGLAAAVVAMLACASCSSSTTTTGRPAKGLSQRRAALMLVQCFIDHQLIQKSALEAGTSGNPPSDSSHWLHDGKVTGNLRFGDWFSDTGSGIAVRGKSIGAWVVAVEASAKAWPAALCGPVPG